MTQRINLGARASEPYQQLLRLHARNARKLGETERRI
jgi:hypothetical protein